ncbi:hypothetical protein [Glycomyces paridis]|uniref:Uncharacterized protein n=1 Tax=Glycomyces paridis TaxID=2126555 RepID=A0A4S8PHT4_9ACTN|nr:hypothetical protein [Glycomyces paridis]THV30157.1 hypothetical protein E9998_07230 [Glycomyces paridis]
MFSNVSARWRRRLRALVVVWAVLLVAVSFWGSRATVREQVGAAEARTVLDGLVGEAAASLTGAAVLAVGPLLVEACDVTPARHGWSLSRTLQVSGATVSQVEDLVARFELRSVSSGPEGASWSGESADFVGLRVTASSAEPAGGRWADPVSLQATSGCRPATSPVGVVSPVPPLEWEPSWDFGSVECPDGTVLASWTEPVEAEPLRVHETSGGCS